MPMTESGGMQTPVTQSLIRLLQVDETSENARRGIEPSERVFEALRSRLSSVLGAGGYATLLARSLALARVTHPVLAGVTPDRTGSLVGRFTATTADATPEEAVCGFAETLTRFVVLLTTFIGADLTNRLLEAVLQGIEGDTPETTRGESKL